MDNRTLLLEGTLLPFPGMPCTVGEVVGRGSNAIVYLGSYPDCHFPEVRHIVLIKELFPFIPSGEIFRADNGEICWTSQAAAQMALHRESFSKGVEVHLQLLAENPADIDGNINTFSYNNTLYSVLAYSGGRSMDKELRSKENQPLLVHISRIRAALSVLEGMHNAGLLHLDISPDNILLIGEGKKERVTIIDYNSVQSMEQAASGTALWFSAKEGYTAPEIRAGNLAQIGFCSDLYALTAVFYRCITGQKLSPLQVIRASVPDVSGAPCLQGMPETVVSMVRQILRKGLNAAPSHRYRSASQMYVDLDELEDRVSGRGISHWSLWEAGRNPVLRMIRDNPSLKYLLDEDQLYPAFCRTESGESLSVQRIPDYLIAQKGTPVFLCGPGGYGKTTALLHIAYAWRRKYVPSEPVVTYLSLYGRVDGSETYISDRILEYLRFKPQTETLQNARHELSNLLSMPMFTAHGEKPKLILLLDGINEAEGNLQPLYAEIRKLSAMDGVRVLICGRAVEESLCAKVLRLMPLEAGEVRKRIREKGFLLPDDPQMLQLLQTPLMLSMFLQTAQYSERQMQLHTAQELLDCYFSALLAKSLKDFPEDSALRWQTETAVTYLLPELAFLERRRNAAFNDAQALVVTKKCQRLIKKGMLSRIFPQWIGAKTAILGNGATQDEWYQTMVHRILWKKLGLLSRNPSGEYQIVHQVLGDYLTQQRRTIDRKLKKRLAVITGAKCLALAVSLLLFYSQVYVPWIAPQIPMLAVQEYDREQALKVFCGAETAFSYSAQNLETIHKLLNVSPEDSEYEWLLLRAEDDLQYDVDVSFYDPAVNKYPLTETGDVMPWSKNPFPTSAYSALINFPTTQRARYRRYVQALKVVYKGTEQDTDAFMDSLQAVVNADLSLLRALYWDVLEPELSGMASGQNGADRDHYDSSMKLLWLNPWAYEFCISGEPPFDTAQCMAQQSNAQKAVERNPIMGKIGSYNPEKSEEGQ